MKRITLQDGCTLTKQSVLSIDYSVGLIGGLLVLLIIVTYLLTAWVGSAMSETSDVVTCVYGLTF